MKIKNKFTLCLTLLSVFNLTAHAITIDQAQIIAQEEAAAAAAAAANQQANEDAFNAIAAGIVALDDSNSITKNDSSITGNVGSNDSGAKTTILTSSPVSDYGSLIFISDGSYTYTLNNEATAVKNLETGEYLNDLFTYQIEGELSITRTAVLTIQILGQSNNNNALNESFYAFDDQASILKGAAEVTGNVTNNDVGGTTYSLESAPSGAYGIMIFSSDGGFNYRLDNSNPDVQALQQGTYLTETFTYKMQAFGQSVTANIVISIIGIDNAIDENFYALNDETSIVKNSDSISGNVATNDIGGISYSLKSSPISSYGDLQFDSVGTYTYRLNNESGAVQSLGLGQFLTDTFTYTMIGTNNTTSADIIIRIIGKSGTLTDEEEAAQEEEAKGFFTVADLFSIVKGDNDSSSVTATGNVLANDSGFTTATLNSVPIGSYGSLAFNNDGSFTYTLNTNSTAVQQLSSSGYLDDIFTYTAQGKSANSGQTISEQGTLTIRILSESWSVTQNVEIEPNDLTTNATPVNSGQLIKGHLQEGTDRDIYQLNSAGNEIIHLELCPKGEICETGKAWVLYAFDGDLFPAIEGSTVTFSWYVTDGTTATSSGSNIISTWQVDHMYLNYWAGNYGNALIGVIDPCHGEANSLDIGVGSGAKTYYIAISNRVQNCDGGDMIQERAGPNVVGPDTSTPPVEVSKPTTEEFYVIDPVNSDQYSISITNTGVNPLQSTRNLAATYSPSNRVLLIPEIQVSGESFSAELGLRLNNKRSGGYQFDVLNLAKIEEELKNNLPATFDPETNRVKIPKYVDDYGVAYSVDLLYYPAQNGQEAYLELIKMDIID